MRKTPRDILLALCLCICVVIPFLPALRGEFTNWDDAVNVLENPYVLKGFSDGLVPLLTRPYCCLYVPVTYATYWAEYHLWGQSAFGFHLVNLLLHAASAVLVFRLLKKLLTISWAAFAAALWWGVHPVNVEAVAWVTGLKDTLSVLLMLISLRFYIAWRDATAEGSRAGLPHWQWCASLIAFGLACLAKPIAAAFPVVLASYDLFVIGRPWKSLRAVAPYFVVSALIVAVTTSLQETEVLNIVRPNLLGRLRVAADSFLFYIKKALWPTRLSPVYGRTVEGVLSESWSWMNLFLAAVIFTTAMLSNKTWRLGIVIFVAGFAPVSGLVPYGYQENSTVADRYIYFSLLGAALMLGDLISRIGATIRPGKPALVFKSYPFFWALALASLTWSQASVWHDSFSLWNHVLKIDPTVSVAYHNRGVAWGEQGNYDEEIKDYTRSLKLRPNTDQSYYNRAAAWLKKGEYDKAIEDYNRTIALKPRSAEARFNRGVAWSRKDDYDHAIPDFTKAIELKHNYAEAYNLRAVAWRMKGNFDEGMKDCQEALKFKPTLASAHNNLGIALATKGDHKQAIEHYSDAIKWDPNYLEAYNNRAISYLMNKKYDEAWIDVRLVYSLGGEVNPAFLERLKRESGQTK